VFVGGFTLTAAAAVYGPNDDLDIISGVASLVDQSLLVPMPVDVEPGSQAQPTDAERFTMLATIREFALERLLVDDDATEIQRRYADYFLAQAEEVYRGHSTANHTVWLRWLVREQNNIREVLRWAATRPDDLTGVRLAGALAFDWLDGGYVAEGRQWLHAVLSQPAGQARTFERGRALVGVGVLETLDGDKAIAIRVLEEGIGIYRELDYRQGLVRALATLGMARSNRGLEEEGVALGRALGDAWNTALALRSLSMLAINGAEARAFLQEGLALARRTGDQMLLGIVYTGLGDVELKLGNYTEAETALRAALDLRQAAGNKYGVAVVLGMLGEVEKGRGDWAQAVAYSEASLGLQRSMGHSVRIGLQLRRLGFATLGRGDADQARSLFQEALTSLEQPDIGAVCVCLLGLAGVAARRGDTTRMRRLWVAAEALRQVDGTPWPPAEQADIERTLATLRSQLDDTTFTRLWAEGQAMTLDEVVNYALSARVSGSAHS
jgi:tetratricopeptide (TPR) repeat protein